MNWTILFPYRPISTPYGRDAAPFMLSTPAKRIKGAILETSVGKVLISLPYSTEFIGGKSLMSATHGQCNPRPMHIFLVVEHHTHFTARIARMYRFWLVCMSVWVPKN